MRRIALLVAIAAASAVGSAHGHGIVVQAGDYAVVTHDGATFVFQETNGKLDTGMINYGTPAAMLRILTDAAGQPPVLEGGAEPTGIQPHDVCYGIFTNDEARSWQGSSRYFYAYVPWQTGGGLGDYVAADWLSFWTARGIDLVALEASGASLAGACATEGGTFVAADTLVAGS